jgi:cytochrome c-type biogenesis protein CcmH
MGHLLARALEARLRRKVGLALALLLLGVAWALPAPGADEKSGWGYQLSKEVMSPYCPGRALSDCPSPQAGELREWIVEQENAGVSRSEVEQQLFRVFGDQLLQAPRAEGMGLMAYLIPALAFAAGGALVVFFLRRQRSSMGGGETAPAPTAPRDPDLEQLVEEELHRS